MKVNPFAVMQEEFDHTGIVFNPDNNRVLTLNKSGVVLWKAFEENCTLDEAAALLVERFDGVTLEDARRDAETFAACLVEKSLLSMD
ncbi:MAG: PqqD family protein [Lentisphaerae bacterium]|nr:PqqD family protein [Lentisphaerota bacterium]